jgi:hypothetical protein
MPRPLITVTRRTKGAADLIKAAIAADRNVMARSPNGSWFRVNLFRAEMSEGYEFWYATPFSHGHLSGRPAPIAVKTLSWYEHGGAQ